MDKLAMLRSFCEKAPGDPFPRYGVAMELRRGGDLAGAVAAFAAMAKDFPDYVPQYLMAGQTLREMGDVPAARAVLDAGIAVATRVGNSHARGELQSARDELDGL